MKPILVLYATREGQTRRIAEHMADALRAKGLDADLSDAATIGVDFSLDPYRSAILIASVHQQHHEKEIVRFVKAHRAALESISAVFLSVSLSEAGAEDVKASQEKRAQAAQDAAEMIDTFLAETGWRPSRVKPVAGALMYSKYNVLIRFVMKQIAKKAGAPTDTSHDYEFTDWMALDKFIDELLQSL